MCKRFSSWYTKEAIKWAVLHPVTISQRCGLPSFARQWKPVSRDAGANENHDTAWTLTRYFPLSTLSRLYEKLIGSASNVFSPFSLYTSVQYTFTNQKCKVMINATRTARDKCHGKNMSEKRSRDSISLQLGGNYERIDDVVGQDNGCIAYLGSLCNWGKSRSCTTVVL